MSRTERRAAALPGYGEGFGVLDICETVHGHCCGSGTGLEPEYFYKCVRFLKICLVTWDRFGENQFDNAVRLLVKETIIEVMEPRLIDQRFVGTDDNGEPKFEPVLDGDTRTAEEWRRDNKLTPDNFKTYGDNPPVRKKCRWG